MLRDYIATKLSKLGFRIVRLAVYVRHGSKKNWDGGQDED